MIASPGDVYEERETIRAVIHDWNDINGSSRRVILTPVGWETHSSPELGARPQELINNRLLCECDILVAVFWTRLGSPTGAAASGTVEEIEEHIARGKPAMIYFSSKPVAPQSIDAEQYSAVQVFKDRMRGLGLIEEFDSVSEFRRKFAKQLQLCLLNNSYIRNIVDEALGDLSNEGNGRLSASQDGGAVPLSEEAQYLLKLATSNEHGIIIKMVTFDGRHIQAGGESLGGHGKVAAKWEGALNELLENDLVVPRGYKGEIFELTYQGWQLAEML